MIVSGHISVGNHVDSPLVLGVLQVGPENVVLRSCSAVGAGTVVVRSWCCSRCVPCCCSNWIVTGRSRESRAVIMACTPGQSEDRQRSVIGRSTIVGIPFECSWLAQPGKAGTAQQPGMPCSMPAGPSQHGRHSGSTPACTWAGQAETRD